MKHGFMVFITSFHYNIHPLHKTKRWFFVIDKYPSLSHHSSLSYTIYIWRNRLASMDNTLQNILSPLCKSHWWYLFDNSNQAYSQAINTGESLVKGSWGNLEKVPHWPNHICWQRLNAPVVVVMRSKEISLFGENI